MVRLLLLLLLAGISNAFAQDIDRLLSAPHRSERNVARDPYRHPAETLAFFGVREDSVVVEILPGSGGYYMELLAPWLQAKGQFAGLDKRNQD